MTNAQIYKRTLSLSLYRLLISLLCALLVVGLPVVVFFITHSMETVCIIASSAAFIGGCIAAGVISHYMGHLLKAGQIAMMAKGVADGQLPDNVLEGAKSAVKDRFITVSAFYVIEKLIRGVTNQVTSGVSKVTESISSATKNDTAETIGSIINILVSIVMKYVCACSLAWVFIHPDENAFKLVCDGAVVYFQNWKALLKNVGKVLLITVLSFAIVCVPLTVVFDAALTAQDGLVEMLDQGAVVVNQELAEEGEESSSDLDGETILMIISFVIALAIWASIHTTLVQPYIQVSVLATYINAAKANPPQVDVYGKLCGISKKFSEAFQKSKEPVTL